MTDKREAWSQREEVAFNAARRLPSQRGAYRAFHKTMLEGINLDAPCSCGLTLVECSYPSCHSGRSVVISREDAEAILQLIDTYIERPSYDPTGIFGRRMQPVSRLRAQLEGK